MRRLATLLIAFHSSNLLSEKTMVRLFLILVSILFVCSCDVISDDDDPVDIAVRLENRGTFAISFIGPNEEFGDATVVQPNRSRVLTVRGIREGDGVFFEAAVRDVQPLGGIFWMQLDARQCFFDGDLDKTRNVFFIGGIGCEGW